MIRVAIVCAVVAGGCGGAARPPVQGGTPIVGNVAEQFDVKIGSELAKRWRAGGLHMREVSLFTVEGTVDDAGVALLRVLGGRVLGTDRSESSVRVMLPNEALPFVIPQTWISHIEMSPEPSVGWSPSTTSAAARFDLTRVPESVRNKLDAQLRTELTFEMRDHYTFAGQLIATGCIDDARRAELIAAGIAPGSVTADEACRESRLTFWAPIVVAPTVAALPWVVAIHAEGKTELN